MKRIVFSMPGNEIIASSIALYLKAEAGKTDFRKFPDQESYVRVLSSVLKKQVIIVCDLYHSDDKILALYFFAKLLKDMGADSITLVAPYLSYMRQDKMFKRGEAVTSEYFAELVSSFADRLITIDPHLHRKHSMRELFNIPCVVLHASSFIAGWIKENIRSPLLIGPDSESEQWVSEVAAETGAPYIILKKVRLGDRKVKISVPDFIKPQKTTPVLMDDIVSSGQTMAETITRLKTINLKRPVCIVIHPVFSENSLKVIKEAGAGKIISCNTIPHKTNTIDISGLIGKALKSEKIMV